MWNLLFLNVVKIVYEEIECYINSFCSAVHGRENRLWVLLSDSWIWIDGVAKVPEERNQQLWYVLVVYASVLELRVWGFLLQWWGATTAILFLQISVLMMILFWLWWEQPQWRYDIGGDGVCEDDDFWGSSSRSNSSNSINKNEVIIFLCTLYFFMYMIGFHTDVWIFCCSAGRAIGKTLCYWQW